MLAGVTRAGTERRQIRAALPEPAAAKPSIPVHYRVRRDRTDPAGVITLRYDSQLRHIGLGREHARTRVGKTLVFQEVTK